MKSINVTELKNRTEEVLRRVREGEKVLITKHGKRRAVLAPVTEGSLWPAGLREYKVAWADIERTLAASRPRFRSWRGAMLSARKRQG